MGRTVRVSMSRKTIVRQRSFGQFLLISLLVGSVFFSGIAYAADSGTTPSKKASSATSEKQKIRQEMAPVNPTPLGLEPMGAGPEKSPTNSQLQSEGTMDRVLHHLLGGPAAAGAYTPPPSQGTTTAGGVPGGNWPGNWWIEGQGGGFNPNTSH
ncbi:hypothetical protein [Leptospirillum ferrooxidans]|uniref:hypothetical protein n=1 Tax=Leptospirillum ferrooxidans TaxID=180 RepID=UPI001E3758D5|nr:hypothetical protein [Leptospirillum ferrooxidans]